jgi:hypothetical protein
LANLPLSARVGVKTLNREQGLERGVRETVDNVEHEEKEDTGSSNGQVLLIFWSIGPFGRQSTISGKHESTNKGTKD